MSTEPTSEEMISFLDGMADICENEGMWHHKDEKMLNLIIARLADEEPAWLKSAGGETHIWYQVAARQSGVTP